MSTTVVNFSERSEHASSFFQSLELEDLHKFIVLKSSNFVHNITPFFDYSYIILYFLLDVHRFFHFLGFFLILF